MFDADVRYFSVYYIDLEAESGRYQIKSCCISQLPPRGRVTSIKGRSRLPVLLWYGTRYIRAPYRCTQCGNIQYSTQYYTYCIHKPYEIFFRTFLLQSRCSATHCMLAPRLFDEAEIRERSWKGTPHNSTHKHTSTARLPCRCLLRRGCLRAV